jgi:hypothetical protein
MSPIHQTVTRHSQNQCTVTGGQLADRPVDEHGAAVVFKQVPVGAGPSVVRSCGRRLAQGFLQRQIWNTVRYWLRIQYQNAKPAPNTRKRTLYPNH